MERLKELLEKFTCNDCDEALSAEELAELRELVAEQFSSAREAEEMDRAEKFAQMLASIKSTEDELAAAAEAEEAEKAERLAEIDRLAGLNAGEGEEVEETEVAVELSEEEEEVTETAAPAVRIELGDFDLTQFQTAEEVNEPDSGDTDAFLNLTAVEAGAGLNPGDRIRSRDELKGYMMELFESMSGRGNPRKTYAASGELSREWDGVIDMDRSEDARHVTQVLWDVAEQQREQAITADGSFCAPVEPDLRFCDLTGPVTGLLSLPTVRAPRGRLQYMTTPRFDDLYALTGIGELFTEADSIAVDPANEATWKTCAEVDCPSQQSVVAIDAHYTCITYKHFTASSYPEYIDFFVRNALKAHVYKQNVDLVTKVEAEAVAVTGPITAAIDSFAALLNALEMRAYSLKRAYWLADDTVIEMALPEWVSIMARHDIAIRQFGDPSAIFSVSDAEVTRLFNDRGLRVQWLKNWQRIGTPGTAVNEAAGAVGDLQLWPNSITALAWIPGTLVAMEAPNFNIGFDVIRDGALIRQNAYQGFAETFEGLATPCDHQVQSWEFEFCPAGETSGPVAVDCAVLVEPAT